MSGSGHQGAGHDREVGGTGAHKPEPNLARFLTAQQGVYERALGELEAGRKRSHWIWFIFPQLRGLGHSAMSWEYGIESLDEARGYLAHRVLGERLRRCARAVNAIPDRSAEEVFGRPDNLKFHSSMTLFHVADPSDQAFADALTHYFEGRQDARTLGLLGLDAN